MNIPVPEHERVPEWITNLYALESLVWIRNLHVAHVSFLVYCDKCGKSISGLSYSHPSASYWAAENYIVHARELRSKHLERGCYP